MDKEKIQPDPRPIPNKPEVADPGVKEQQEIIREKKEIENQPGKENIERPEIPEIPEELPEKKDPE